MPGLSRVAVSFGKQRYGVIHNERVRAMMSEALIEAAKQSIISYNEKDWAKAEAVHTDDFVYEEVATHRRAEGISDVLEIWKGWGAGFPDSKATFHDAQASGDTVILEKTWTGTHTGPLVTPDGVVEATGKSFSMRAISVIVVRDGKVALSRQYFDLNTMLSQLGLS